MGLYDSFYLRGRWADQIRCPYGHRATFELQSKDIDCAMAEIVIKDDGRYNVIEFWGTTCDYGKLDCVVEVNGECRQCAPLHLTTRTTGYNHVYPSIVVRLQFTDGRLVSAERTIAETYDDIRQTFADNRNGVRVVEPDDCDRCSS